MDLKVSAQSVQAIAVRNMREAIKSGHFQPGERLVESEMCTRLGISRPSLREALRSLEAERLIVIVPNKGPSIPILTVAEAREIYDVRSLLEGEAAALACTRATAKTMAAMTRALQDFDAAVADGDLDAQVRTTQAFYDEMLAACGHRLIRETLATLTARITFLRSLSMSIAGRAGQSSKEMWAILNQVAARQPDRARAAAAKHVRKACDTAVKAYERTPYVHRAPRA